MAERTDPHSDDEPAVPLGGTRGQAVHRLQVGLSLLGGVILLVGLANVIEDRAKESDAARVPQAAATVSTEPVAPPQSDPLADAGVVPDLPAEPSTQPTPEKPILPEQGNVPAAR